MAKRIITEADVLAAAGSGQKTLDATPGECLVTDQARDRAALLGLTLLENGERPDAPGQALCETRQADCPTRSEAVPARPMFESGEAELARQVTLAVCAKLPAPADRDRVERLVREALAARSRTGPTAATADALASAEVVPIESAALFAKCLAQGLENGTAVMAEAFGGPDQPGLCAGCLCWEKASFPREVDQPEIDVVIEGELRLNHGARTLMLKAGDMVYLRRGAKVVYAAPGSVKIVCINGVC